MAAETPRRLTIRKVVKIVLIVIGALIALAILLLAANLVWVILDPNHRE